MIMERGMYYGIAQHEYGPRTTHFSLALLARCSDFGTCLQAAAPMELGRALRPVVRLGSSGRGERLCN